MRKTTAYTTVLAMGFLTLHAWGSEFRTYGPRALSMGGAGVARPDGAYAVYYNPAALASEADKTAIALSAGVGVRDTGAADHLSNLMDLDWEGAINNPTVENVVPIIAELLQLEDSDGILFTPAGALTGHRGPVGAGIYGGGEIAVHSELDLLNIVADEDSANSFANNESKLYAQGLAVAEVPVGYGRQFELGAGKLNVGGAIKYMQGYTYNAVLDNLSADSDTIEEELQNADKASSSFGVDAGLQYQAMEDALSIGLLVRNINSPEFDTTRGDETFKEDMQARAGVAYSISERVSAAVDIDVTANETLIGGYESRQLGGGLCFQATDGISLRGGLMTNLEADDAPLVWCAGASLGTENFHFDIAGAIAGEQFTFDEITLPAECSITLALWAGW